MTATAEEAAETLQMRIHGNVESPVLIYLPGLHGDWTLATSFRNEISHSVRYVEFTYPRSLRWSLADYAAAIRTALLEAGITEGWLLAESFGSQIAWTLADPARPSDFRINGIILAGGFVKHPNAPGIALVKRALATMPPQVFQSCLKIYAKYATVRHRQAPETLAAISETVSRRTELDRRAMMHRLDLLAGSQLKPNARQADFPVYALAGFWDPIVPRMLTIRWLKRHCPGFRESAVVFRADHNVLGTAPNRSAQIILDWLNQGHQPDVN